RNDRIVQKAYRRNRRSRQEKLGQRIGADLFFKVFDQGAQRNDGGTLLVDTIFYQFQFHIEDYPEQPVPADRVPEQTRILRSAYGLHRSVGQEDSESKHAADQGRE